MAETDAIKGFGTLIQVSDMASPAQFRTVAEVRSISGPAFTRGSVDVTHMESPDEHEEFIPALASGAEVTLQVNLLAGDTSHQNVLSYLSEQDKAYRHWRIAWPDWGTHEANVTVDTVNDEIDLDADIGLEDGSPVRLTADVLPTSSPQVVADKTYFVKCTGVADSFTLHLTNADAIAGANDITFSAAGTNVDAEIGSWCVFHAFVTGWNPSEEPAAEVKGEVTLKVTGPPTCSWD